MSGTGRVQSYTLSGVPPLVGPCTLLVGLDECEDGSVKAYLGARWKNVYLRVEPEGAEDFRRAWGSGGHVWMHPVPPASLLCRDEIAPASVQSETDQ